MRTRALLLFMCVLTGCAHSAAQPDSVILDRLGSACAIGDSTSCVEYGEGLLRAGATELGEGVLWKVCYQQGVGSACGSLAEAYLQPAGELPISLTKAYRLARDGCTLNDETSCQHARMLASH